jgi:hypothetical protein
MSAKAQAMNNREIYSTALMTMAKLASVEVTRLGSSRSYPYPLYRGIIYYMLHLMGMTMMDLERVSGYSHCTINNMIGKAKSIRSGACGYDSVKRVYDAFEGKCTVVRQIGDCVVMTVGIADCVKKRQ